MLKIYGPVRSRAFRTIWMAQELGIAYERVDVSLFGDNADAKKDWYLAINPNAKVPAIDLDGFKLWESSAIHIYLAKKYNSPLVPKTLEGEAEMLKWAFWAVNEVEPRTVAIMWNRVVAPLEKRNEAAAKDAEQGLRLPLKVLEQQLSKSAYLLGGEFSLADFNVAAILYTAYALKLDLSGFPKVQGWLMNCIERPAAKAARKLREA